MPAKIAPGFDRLREIVAPGHVIVCWEASRLSRDLGALIGLRDLCIERGVAMSYGGQLVDLDEPKFVIDGMISEQEAKKTRDRILRAHRANLAEGKPHGRVPYGYKIVRDPDTGKSTGRTPDPDRAPLVQEAARRVLAGQSFGSVVRWIETKDPIGWDSAKLRRILTNATYAGYRTNSTTVGGKRGPQEIHGTGTWEPILTDEQHHDLVALFAGRKTGPRGVPVKHLLTGIARCAVRGVR